MTTQKLFNVIGIMTGTSMDGMDFSYVTTDGKKYVKIIKEYYFPYSKKYKKDLRKIINLYNKKNIINHDLVTRKFIFFIEKFIKKFKISKNEIDLIGMSGQTIYHNPYKKKSIQLGSCYKISKKLKIKVVGEFRKNDIKNGGQGAPIGAFYHKYILEKYNKKAIILNLGGIANISYIKNKKIYASDIGPANTIIDDLMNYHFKKNFDNKGIIASKGKKNNDIIKLFKKDIFFNLKPPKSLDREYFNKYLKILKKIEKKESIKTATLMTFESILIALDKINIKINSIILTGGGRKNLFLFKKLRIFLKKNRIQVYKIDKFKLNGDFIESQTFAYLAVRSLKQLHLSTPFTTGVSKSISGGKLFF